MSKNRKSHFSFLLWGLVLAIGGLVLLLTNQGLIMEIELAWPVVLMIVGIIMVISLYVKWLHDRMAFLAALVFLTGAFLTVLSGFYSFKVLAKFWPLLATILGLSLLYQATFRKKKSRIVFTVPGIIIIGLSGLFLPFSAGWIKLQFMAFVREWWPAIPLVMGLSLVITWLAVNHSGKVPENRAGHEEPKE